ncbi:Uncharacterized [Syntrophomonas zehnderi OL-4]|uniref:Uncharacterized n=1 Tax=Syntrophomonas zehnderi OL-4 TaxID=690567 RepID=A0A0E4C7X2_9FIRM|nr:TraC family protein [Syntrophomonas zehnderi]CFX16367.1 Uncharacterized [Syntrophomonas zehnderi OL-4]
MFKKRGNKPEASIKEKEKMTAQDWLPIKDITSHFLFRKDGQLVAVLKIEPINIVLKSDSEKKRIVSAVHEAWNGIQYAIQILALPRPVDLDKYLDELQEIARETTDIARKRILQEYIHYIAGIVRGGEALERRYYLLISMAEVKQGKEELLKRAYELAANLETSGLKVNICDDVQIIDMAFSFLHPSQSAFEQIPTPAGITTIYREGGM